MRVDLFDFDLPEDLIALRPAEPRDAARLLVVRPDGTPELADHCIADLPDLLAPGDILVANDTRVIPARLTGRRLGRGDTMPKIEATLHRREAADRWRAFVKPARKLTIGDKIAFAEDGTLPGNSDPCSATTLMAEVAEKGEGGEVLLVFELSGAALDGDVQTFGAMPLPPYIAARRAPDGRDRVDYQTMFATREGAVAAPTAGLHFTDALKARLAASGIEIATITLHVGAGTFLPVKAEDTEDHRMHGEWGEVGAEAAARLNAVRAAGGRIVAVGTTVLRLLESAADADGIIGPFSGETDIFITPGYRFRAVDALLTNFHLPRSTLFMLVAAFCGLDMMKRAYAHAIARGYRFYSYGDASLLFPAGGR